MMKRIAGRFGPLCAPIPIQTRRRSQCRGRTRGVTGIDDRRSILSQRPTGRRLRIPSCVANGWGLLCAILAAWMSGNVASRLKPLLTRPWEPLMPSAGGERSARSWPARQHAERQPLHWPSLRSATQQKPLGESLTCQSAFSRSPVGRSWRPGWMTYPPTSAKANDRLAHRRRASPINNPVASGWISSTYCLIGNVLGALCVSEVDEDDVQHGIGTGVSRSS